MTPEQQKKYDDICDKIDSLRLHNGRDIHCILNDLNEVIPCGFKVWNAWLQLSIANPEIKRVSQDVVPDTNYWVSTVFLGMDMSFLPEEDPQVFETQVFENHTEDSLGIDRYQQRYSTWEQAEAGHAKIMLDMIDGTLELY